MNQTRTKSSRGGAQSGTESRDLERALATFEKNVATPVISGELRSWCVIAREGLASIREAWNRNRADRERRMKEIQETDLALAKRVENLEVRDDELLGELGDIDARLAGMLRDDAEEPEASREPAVELEKLREKLLGGVARCRGHDKEIDAWMVEALYRDRGGGD